MGNNTSASFDTETANDLYFKESAKRGLQVAKAAGTSILLSPVIILALPFVGAYEFSTALQEEMITGYKIMDGMIGGLFGVIASPIAPLYCFLTSMQEIFSVSGTSQQHGRHINQSYLRKAYGMLRLDVNVYNVVVTGCPGTGKSSLLNALLGYRNNHPKAAAVGEIETTPEPKKYQHRLLPTLHLWDMPGIGTPRHPTSTFFDTYFLGAFDAILIVFDDRLMASNVEIARKAKLYDLPVFFIKHKADLITLPYLTDTGANSVLIDITKVLDRQKEFIVALSIYCHAKPHLWAVSKHMRRGNNCLHFRSSNGSLPLP